MRAIVSRNLPILMFSNFVFLAICFLISVGENFAQDIPNTEITKAIIPAPQKKKSIKPAKTKEIKTKTTVATIKNNSSLKFAPFKSKPKNTIRKTPAQSYTVVPVNQSDLITYEASSVSGIVRFKQLNQAASGVLIEAIRADTKKMIGSAETDAAGAFKFEKLPVGVTLIFLVSSPKTQSLIMQTAVTKEMRNLNFTVFAK